MGLFLRKLQDILLKLWIPFFHLLSQIIFSLSWLQLRLFTTHWCFGHCWGAEEHLEWVWAGAPYGGRGSASWPGRRGQSRARTAGLSWAWGYSTLHDITWKAIKLCRAGQWADAAQGLLGIAQWVQDVKLLVRCWSVSSCIVSWE